MAVVVKRLEVSGSVIRQVNLANNLVRGAGANVEMIASVASRVIQYFIIKERDRDQTVWAIRSIVNSSAHPPGR